MNFLLSWAALTGEVGVDPDAAQALGLELAARHEEPHRHYHRTEHIEAVLGHLQTLGVTTPVARFAAFFHDAIYDATRTDNEERSALLAESRLADLGPIDVAHPVAAIVRATATHSLGDATPRETPAFLDADLAILGAPPATYDGYVAAIRKEYSHVSDEDFVVGRAAVIRSFNERPTLYFTSSAQVRWEAAARANMARELASLAG